MAQPGSQSIRRQPAFLVVLVAVFFGAIDLTVVATILPRMIGDLGINSADIDRYIWVVNAYLIAYIVSIPLFGRLSDILGARNVYIAALVIFAAGSWWCSTSDSLQHLIVARAIQGFGGGALLPIGLAVAVAMYEGDARHRAIGAVGAADTFGWVSGPAYGAIVVSWLSSLDEPWRVVFWINIPFAVILAALAWNALGAIDEPSSTRTRSALDAIHRLDPVGFLLLAVVLVALNLGLASGGEIGATAGRGLRAFGGTPNPLGDYIPWLIGIAAVAAIALVFWIRKHQDPFVPRRLLHIDDYRASLWANFLLGTALMTGMVMVPVIVALIETSANTATRSALLLAPFTLAIAALSIVSGVLMERVSAGVLVLAGMVLTVVGNVLVYPLLDAAAYEWMSVGLAIAGAGIGLALTPLSSTALDRARADERGAAASTLLVARLLGMTIGVSVLTSLGVQRLQTLTGRLEPLAQDEGESTAAFLLRQQQYIIDKAIPLGVQVVQETFLAAALLATIALIPGLMLYRNRAELADSRASRTEPG
jgi:EmrB/QacA subfamily drug resistance transporter